MTEQSTLLTLLLLVTLNADVRGRLSLDSSGHGQYFCGRQRQNIRIRTSLWMTSQH